MAAGHIVAGQCVDVAVSLDVYYSNAQPAQSAGVPTFSSVFSKSLTGWTQDTYKNGDLFTSVPAPIPIFPDCDTTASFYDGLQLGWGVAAVMIAVYVIRRPYR